MKRKDGKRKPQQPRRQLGLLRSLVERLSRRSVPAELRQLGVSREDLRKLQAELEREAARPPRIALIGETGVGKSTTLNALFNAGRPISHTEACTQSDFEFVFEGSKGNVAVVDMPGIGEDIEADAAHLQTYARVLPTCDVALWVLKADNRAVTNIQRVVKQLVEDRSLDPRQLVIGLNQVDQLQPGAWDVEINQPSDEQRPSIAARVADVESKLRRVCDLPKDRVVPYSATKGYALDHLLHSMLDACDRKRQWVLFERADCVDFTALVDPRLLDEATSATAAEGSK